MLTHFHQASTVLQTVLLVISQFATIALASGILLLFTRKSSRTKLIGLSAAWLINTILCVLMQLDSRLAAAGQRVHLHLPSALLLLVMALSLGFYAWVLLSETRNRKTISQSSIKEAFDNLPTGVCFFSGSGLPVLCNHAMQRFSFAVCGKDVQLITDLESCLADDFIPVAGVQKDGKVFVRSDGQAWQLERRSFTHGSGNHYTQFVAIDVSELQKSRVALQQETAQLRHVQADLQRLSANIVAATREEEILNTKMRVHDEMGRCLVAAQKYLREDCTESIPDSLAAAWQRAVSMIKYNIDTPEEDMLLQIRKTCEHMKIAYLQTGTLPDQEGAAYLLTCAVRECVTNAVRYAEATELYVSFSETEADATVSVTNNGKIPEGEITEGGGLSTLRRRVERAGGTMNVRSQPGFRLTVTVPKEKGGIL